MGKARQPLRFVLSSVASWAVDVGLFYVFDLLLGGLLGPLAEAVCNVAARALSSFFNFNVNNRLVFRSELPYAKSLLRYYCLAVPQLAVSTALIALFVWLLHVESAEGSTIVKTVVDGILFVVSFFIQKIWVFSKKKAEQDSAN